MASHSGILLVKVLLYNIKNNIFDEFFDQTRITRRNCLQMFIICIICSRIHIYFFKSYNFVNYVLNYLNKYVLKIIDLFSPLYSFSSSPLNPLSSTAGCKPPVKWAKFLHFQFLPAFSLVLSDHILCGRPILFF